MDFPLESLSNFGVDIAEVVQIGRIAIIVLSQINLLVSKQVVLP
jgi:hypothetical protein